MTGARALGIVLLAAGGAVRYGSAKQLLPIDGEPLVRRMARAALQVSPRVAVVIGAYKDDVEAALDGLPLDAAFHAGWPSGMGGSLAFGLGRLRERHPELAAVMVCLCDQPALGATQLQALANAAGAERIVAADYGDGVLGVPCLFPARFFHELELLHGPEGARSLLMAYADQVQALPMPEARIDIDTPDDYERWRTGSG
jgi:molybdenum cofactor cytidylyltransferase